MMHIQMTGRVITISGGCGDLGLATAKRLAACGAKVVLMDIVSQHEGEARAKSVAAAAYCLCDQSQRDQVNQTIDSIVQRFARLDCIIANAAIVRRAAFEDISDEDWQAYLDVNLSGPFYLARKAAQIMLRQTPVDEVRGRILFTSSWTAQHPLPGGVPYVVTKGALEAMTRAMAQELSPRGIRVNALAPGLVYAGLTRKLCEQTNGLAQCLQEMVPLGKLGTAEQVADAYLFLCSPLSDYMTGQVLTVDGGCSVIKRELAS